MESFFFGTVLPTAAWIVLGIIVWSVFDSLFLAGRRQEAAKERAIEEEFARVDKVQMASRDYWWADRSALLAAKARVSQIAYQDRGPTDRYVDAKEDFEKLQEEFLKKYGPSSLPY